MNANREIEEVIDQLTKAIMWQAVTNLMALLFVMIILALVFTR